MKKIGIIGGGAAGLMAAYTAAKNGNEVFLFEKNEKLGKKIYITGKGRCNFTNDTSPENFLDNVVRGNKFLKGCIYAFPPQKTIDFFESYGLSVKVERGGRVFPFSDHASDVTKTLEKACKSVGVKIFLNEKVLKIATITSNIIPMSNIDVCTSCDIIPTSDIVRLETDKNIYEFNKVIVATGGISYPTTGSTGDGYRFAKELNIKVTDLKCGLCGINLKQTIDALQGLSLKNVQFTIKREGKILYSQFGELLFTHFGISGPIVLSASSIINRQQIPCLEAYIDLKPSLDDVVLDKRILRDFEKYKNKQIVNALLDLLPQKLILPVLLQCGIPERKLVNGITKEERERLVKALKHFSLSLKDLRGFEEAIITSGGIDLSEINPKTMESKKRKGIYFCGEVLDVDAFTGGFNLQIAFSTGYAAGKSV